MKLKTILIAIAFTAAACGGAESEEQTASTTPEAVEAVEVVAAEVVLVEAVAGPKSIASSNDELTSEIPAPLPSADVPTTTVAPTTTTTTATTTTAVAEDPEGDPACATSNYEVVLPTGWFHENCTTFSETAFPGPNAEIEFRPEIDLFFASGETFREALLRLERTETILSSEGTTVNGAQAVRLEIDEGFSEFFGASGRRMTYVVDAGHGVFFAAGVENVDAASILLHANTVEQYANTVAQLDVMMASLALNDSNLQPVICPSNTGILDPEVVTSGEADLDGDGDLEQMQLIYDRNDTPFVTIEGLVPGIVLGEVEGQYPDPFHMLGWDDWDGDGSPEIITREGAGPAAGDLLYVSTVIGCDIVPVTGLLSTGSTQYSDLYRCHFGADGTMTSFTNRSWRADVSVEPYVFTTTTTESTYVAGVLLSSEPVTTVSNEAGGEGGYGNPPDAVTWGLSSCGEFFDSNS